MRGAVKFYRYSRVVRETPPITDVLRTRLERITDLPPAKLVVRLALDDGRRVHLVATDRWRLFEAAPDESPTFVVKAHPGDLIDLLDGHADLDAAMFDGRVRIAGDLGQAMRWVPVLFAPVADH